jgi:hypothetical protein
MFSTKKICKTFSVFAQITAIYEKTIVKASTILAQITATCAHEIILASLSKKVVIFVPKRSN